MKKLSIALMALWAIVGQAQAQEAKTVRIASDGESPPYAQMAPSGKPEGFEIDLLADLCARAKFECTMEVTDFSGIIPALVQGKFDVIVASMSITDKRKEVIAFSVPYGGGGNVWATTKQSPIASMPGTDTAVDLTDPSSKSVIDGMRELVKGKTIGAQAASVSADFLHKYFGDVADVREYEKNEEINLDLANGRLDAAVNSKRFFKAAIDSGGEFSDMVIVGPSMDRGPFGEGIGFGFRKEDTALRQAFNDALAAAGKDGTMTKLYNKWFGFDLTPAALRP